MQFVFQIKIFFLHTPLRNFHLIKRVFSINGNFVKGCDLKNNELKFLFKILRWAKRSIKVCYVNIGLLVTGNDLLCFSNKSFEGQAKCERGKGSEQKRNVLEYEPKANEIIIYCLIQIVLFVGAAFLGVWLGRLFYT